MNRLRAKYQNEAIPSLKKEFGYTNVMAIPRVEKVVINMGLGEAIARLSSLPASRAGLSERGRLAPGAAADVVVFDPATISETATPARPFAPAVGVRHVLVNGEPAVADGRLTGVRAGRILRG